ncbi:hypothetical protein HPB47_027646 [Ixodes persulcatus]|uniref:Uncharacterized protein n=1 Tax=Ixodes persulcatus TaxID=34615 RepID=A0AC60PVN2_IXOPE|nr:hypothetical protein HPB47_027646 [Ixodes persulcatus]
MVTAMKADGLYVAGERCGTAIPAYATEQVGQLLLNIGSQAFQYLGRDSVQALRGAAGQPHESACDLYFSHDGGVVTRQIR